MSVGGRVQELLDSHGHSYAKAEEVTGVCRETIRRICLGFKSPKLRKYIRQIANGCRVDELAILEGASPKGEFEWFIRQAPPNLRLSWLKMAPAQRVKLTLNFLKTKYPDKVSVAVLAIACGKSEAQTFALLEKWSMNPPDRQTALTVGKAINRLTGIPMCWFTKGRLSEAWSEPLHSLPRLVPHVRMRIEASTSEGLAALIRMVGPANH